MSTPRCGPKRLMTQTYRLHTRFPAWGPLCVIGYAKCKESTGVSRRHEIGSSSVHNCLDIKNHYAAEHHLIVETQLIGLGRVGLPTLQKEIKVSANRLRPTKKKHRPF